MPEKSKSQVLRNVLYKVYEGLSNKYRDTINFEKFYETEMDKLINHYKNKI